jgi:predicted small lipoprotein YifL
MIRTLIGALALATLAACATTPPTYGPAPSSNAAGYSETQIESNRYFVTYRAPGATEASTLEDYALRRAAELTLQNGREWFWVDRRSVDDEAPRGGPSVGVGVGGGSWGGSGGVGASVGFNFPLGGGGQRARAATLEVRFGEGPKPDQANAYDARAVLGNISAR